MLLDITAEIFPVFIIHYQVGGIIGEKKSTDVDYIRVSQGGQSLGFLVEQLASIVKGIFPCPAIYLDLAAAASERQFFGQVFFDDNMVLCILIFRQVNETEAAAAYQFNDRVAVDDSAWWQAVPFLFRR